MPAITTERLTITEAVSSDGPFFQKLTNSPSWLEFIGDRGIDSEEKAREYIHNTLIKSYGQNEYGLYKVVLKALDTPIGICGLVKRAYLPCPDIGFALLPAYEGQGFGLEAAKAVIEDSTIRLGIRQIFAITTPRNTKSKALLHKIGFVQVDTITPPRKDEQFLLFSNEGTVRSIKKH